MKVKILKMIGAYKNNLKNHGLKNVLYQQVLLALNKIIFLRGHRCLVISKVKESFLIIDSKFEHGFADKDKLFEFSIVKDNQLSHNFLNSSLPKGDKCYALTEEGELASYGWYSNTDTKSDVKNLLFSFDPSYVYMYKGLTKNNYRGQRLHAIGMTLALKSFLELGPKGIVSYVDITNLDSLKSCMRMGYEQVGTIWVIEIFGTIFHSSSRGCKKYNMKFINTESQISLKNINTINNTDYTQHNGTPPV